MSRQASQDPARRLQDILALIDAGVPTLTPFLPLLLNLGGKPYTLDDFFPFEPFFRTHMPRKLVFKTGRQVSKSTSLAAQGVIQSLTIPRFNTLFVLPLYELTRRFSVNYVRPFLEESPVRKLLVGPNTINSVLQRTLANHSTMFFSFAFLDVTRTRGINADKTVYDEVQDLDKDFIPIIRETMSASRWGFEQFTGTPKTLENTLSVLFEQSSQAEWCIRCKACNHWNIPALGHDLDAMTGPDVVTRPISEESPGVVCAKCGRPIYPRTGRWVHRYPDRRNDFAGYHVPQLILPKHYADSEKWRILLAKRRGMWNTPLNLYYNECCGEAYDTGVKLVSIADLKAAATLHPNEPEAARATIGRYKSRVLGVDWGGGGREEVSFTTVAVLGLLPDGRIDCLYGWRSLTPHDPMGEVERIMQLVSLFECQYIVHDYSGAGTVREGVLVQAGFPAERSIPIAYVRSTKGPMMRFVPENPNTGQRGYYQVDKARSLTLTCLLVKKQQLRFFAYDYRGPDQPGLLHDFLALTEEKSANRVGSDFYTILRDDRLKPDDFAQAGNLGGCALYYQEGRWPHLAEIDRLTLSPEHVQYLQSSRMFDWQEWS